MQALPDKDFNRAFQKKFENFEVEPPSRVWKGIAAGLNTNSQKKPFPVFRITAVAASVLIVLSTCLWLFTPKEKIRLQGKANNQLVEKENGSARVSTPVVQEKTAKPVNTVNKLAGPPVLPANRVVRPVVPERKEQVQEASQLAETTVKEIVQTKPDIIVINEEKPNTVKDQPVIASYPLPAQGTKAYTTQRRRVKNVGDVVNMVVGIMDPREDKIIRFTNDGEGGTQVSGINLGLLRIKSRNK